jgi:hypothetical protein
MSPHNDTPDSRQESLESAPAEKRAGRDRTDRIIFFVIIVFIASGAAFGMWIRYGIGAAMTAGAGSGSSPVAMIGFLWAAVVVGSAVLLFRK